MIPDFLDLRFLTVRSTLEDRANGSLIWKLVVVVVVDGILNFNKGK